jgi:hypothetical protein
MELDKTNCTMRTISFLSALFLSFDKRMPYLQIISPDLSVTVFVTLHLTSKLQTVAAEKLAKEQKIYGGQGVYL